MHVFSVWAPTATSVEVHLPGLPGSPRPMHPTWHGWWELEAPDAGHGTDYAFSVDGGPQRPDPRTAWQPHGVHESSRVFDPLLHLWQDRDWPGPAQGAGVLGRVFYELHIGTFTPEGTLDAAIGYLPHLVELGVDVVELMPVGAYDGRWGWGYDGVAPGAVHPAYGGPEALQRFVDAAHAQGLGVCLDVVENHLGPSGNYLAEFAPYFTDRHSTPWGQAVNLDDEGSGQVRRWILDRALRWFTDFHVDALRIDAAHEMYDDSGWHVLAQLSDETAELSRHLRRPLALVAETDRNDPRTVEPTSEQGLGMTAQWADDVHHALHAALSGERSGYYVDFGSMATLAHALTRVFVHEGGWSTFRGQDWGRPVEPGHHPGHRFVVFLHNHDQVGNRALGDRLSTTVDTGLLAAGAALILTSPFTPMLFMGEEWGASTPWQFFTDFADPELGRAVVEGRRGEFAQHGWDAQDIPDPQDPRTRDASVLRWSERDEPEHLRLLRWHHDLIALRRTAPDLQLDDLRPGRAAYQEEGRWLTLTRGELLVAVNLGDEPAQIPVGEHFDRVLLSWESANLVAGQLILPAHSATVIGPG